MEYFSTTYERLADGSLVFRVATLESGEQFSMTLSAEEAVENLQAFARTLGLVVARPLP